MTGDNGLLTKSRSAIDKYSEGEIEEQIKLANIEYETTRLTNTNLDFTTFMKESLEKIYGINSIDIIKDKNDEKYYYIVIKKTKKVFEFNTSNKNVKITNKLPGQYRFIKIEITKVKEYGIQMSEFNFYDENNNRFEYPQ